MLAGVDDPGQLADMAAYSPDLTMEQRVELLETIDVEARLELVLGWTRETLADLELKDKIRTDVTDGLDKQQREMLLRRQMDAIRKELGEGDDDVVAEYRAKLAEHGAARHGARRGRQGARQVRAHGRSRIPSRRGSATGSTRCSTCRGATYATESNDDLDARAPCSTPITTASTT